MKGHGSCSLCKKQIRSTGPLCGMLCLKGCGGILQACHDCGDDYPAPTREKAMFIRLESEHVCKEKGAEANASAA